MMDIDALFAETLQSVCLDPALFPGSEEITYHPYNGTPKSIRVIVSREGSRPNFTGGKTIGSGVEIWIPNNAETGVTSVNSRDTVTMKVRVDGQPVSCTVDKFWPDSDSAFIHLTVKGV